MTQRERYVVRYALETAARELALQGHPEAADLVQARAALDRGGNRP